MTAGEHPTPSAPFRLRRPAAQSMAVVFASPHSGTDYPPAFLAGSRLALDSLRRSEDCWVDELFAAAPSLGAPLLAALFPRSFVDPNREALELDPQMFEDALPRDANTGSPRVAAGLGVIPRVVATGEEIYGRKLAFAEAAERIQRYWRPYHAALAAEIQATRRRFGTCVLIDCHSMPSAGGAPERETGWDRVDFVLGDCRGTSCAPALTEQVEIDACGAWAIPWRATTPIPAAMSPSITAGRPRASMPSRSRSIAASISTRRASGAAPASRAWSSDMSELIRSLAALPFGLAAAAE